MNPTLLAKSNGTGGAIRRLVLDAFRVRSWVRRLARRTAAGPQRQEGRVNQSPESTTSARIVLTRKRAEDPTRRYEELVRRRVTLLACRRGGPALEVGTGPWAPMAQRLARCGMQVTAVDQEANAVISATRMAAAPELEGRMKVRQANACRLPFDNNSYRVVLAFDSLGHAHDPKRILAEMFRVRSYDGIVLITEYNKQGRRATRHRNFGFERRVAAMLQTHCDHCRRIEHPHHVTFVCG